MATMNGFRRPRSTGGIRPRAAIIDMFGTYKHRGRSWREVLAAHGVALDDRIAAKYLSQAADGGERIAASRSRESYTSWEKARIVRAARSPQALSSSV